MPALAISTTVAGSLDSVIARTTEALATEGFGVLTRIDVHTTFKKKLGVEFRPYVILGACNPALAHAALSSEPEVGLLLPCNVTVQEVGDEMFSVQFVNPEFLLGVIAPTADSVLTTLLPDAVAAIERAAAALEG